MHGTHFAQFSTEVLHRGAAAVLPQHLPDRWLDALLEEADLLAPEEGDAKEGDRVEDCCAGLLGAVLVVLMEHGGHPDTLEVAASTLMRHMQCYILALAAERVSRDTEIGSNHRRSRTCLTRSARCRRGGVRRARPQRARAGGSRALPQAGSPSERSPLPWPRHTAAAAMTTAARVLLARSAPHALGKRGRTSR